MPQATPENTYPRFDRGRYTEKLRKDRTFLKRIRGLFPGMHLAINHEGEVLAKGPTDTVLQREIQRKKLELSQYCLVVPEEE